MFVFRVWKSSKISRSDSKDLRVTTGSWFRFQSRDMCTILSTWVRITFLMFLFAWFMLFLKQVRSGSGIWPKNGAGFGKTPNIVTGFGIWLLPVKRDSPKFAHGMRDILACLSGIREIVTSQINVLAAKANQPGECKISIYILHLWIRGSYEKSAGCGILVKKERECGTRPPPPFPYPVDLSQTRVQRIMISQSYCPLKRNCHTWLTLMRFPRWTSSRSHCLWYVAQLVFEMINWSLFYFILQEATSVENLSRMYIGWAPYLWVY